MKFVLELSFKTSVSRIVQIKKCVRLIIVHNSVTNTSAEYLAQQIFIFFLIVSNLLFSLILLVCHFFFMWRCLASARLIDSHFYSLGPIPIGGASINVGGSRGARRPYSAINDPHLYDYYVRKFIAVEPLQPAKPKVT